jgi:hypothetical protein
MGDAGSCPANPPFPYRQNLTRRLGESKKVVERSITVDSLVNRSDQLGASRSDAMTFPSIRETLPTLRQGRILGLVCVASVGFANAQQTQPDRTQGPQLQTQSETSIAGSHPGPATKPRAGIPVSPETTPSVPIAPEAAPGSPSDVTPGPAQVKLGDGRLTVDAHNSDLSAILRDVASASGMKIEGLDKTARVFGVYGPGTPGDVLTDLLSGTGYNFVMLGGANGSVPRELILTAQNISSPTPGAASNRTGSGASAPSADSDDNDADPQEPLGPGAIAHPPPAPPDDPRARVQQRLENLQKMQQSQQQQQNSPQ